MDDVDAVQAQIARNMLESGDWTTAHLNGVPYLEKSPLIYWTMAASYSVFGVHDWSARLPLALLVVILCWLTARFSAWAFGNEAGLYSGLAIATCVGLFLFTRILIPDAQLTLVIALAMWSFLRVLEPDEPRPKLWAAIFAASLGTGLLLKGLISVVFPIGAAIIYLAITRQLLHWSTWKKLRPFSGLLMILFVAAPWHILATLRNPPYFAWTLHSGPGSYKGFLWFYLMNEHVLRFLNMRYPRDYDTVPRLWFWGLHLLWLFPWSFYFAAITRLSFKPVDRAGHTRLLALCWIGFVMVFFTFSTTQEYYSLPIYPAVALLLGSAIATRSSIVRIGTKAVAITAALAFVAIAAILFEVRGIRAIGDISSALTQDPQRYTLSMGHMGDLTLRSFAYLRVPLVMAGVAMLIGAVGIWIWRKNEFRAALAMALMMVIFFHAARVAMVAFDPYLGSKPLADALMAVPEGKLIEADAYYSFSSVFFYTNKRALLLNGRINNLEYGSNAPKAPQVFIGDADFQKLWTANERTYLLVTGETLPHITELVGQAQLHVIKENGGNFLLTNLPRLSGSR
ncbi:MAG: glycosyl transferase, family 39 [Acidobacteriales bacterium]|nr:glycosyl transferase, family 39 [Terriglobales bacterium]